MQALPVYPRRLVGLIALAVASGAGLSVLPGRAAASEPHPAGGSATAVGPAGQTQTPPPAADDTLESLAAEATEAVVLLDVRTESGSRQGSGFIVEPDGRIFTNHHVVEDARSIEVKLASGDVYERVKIMAVDERRDIAVLEIPGFDLPTVPLGSSDSVRVGTSIIAIGSPLGLENTVSTGIVSGRRSEPEGFDLLQISAPTSQGSSGGPVITKSGEVIGIAVSQMRNGQNLNFALPINYARGLLAHLDQEPVAVLAPSSREGGGGRSEMSSDPSRVNRGLGFDLDGFRGYTLKMVGGAGEGRRQLSRVTYRRIETVGGRPNIERYAETETTERTGPFGTPQTVRRTRSRAILAAGDLRPVSVRGEISWWRGDDRRVARYNLRFDDDYHVEGTVTDTTGHVREVDRDLPRGTLLRSTRHLAFATLAEDSLVGRSVEFVTFDAASAELTSDRYDVRATTAVRVDGKEYAALRVNLASGLANSTAYFRRTSPRVLLRRETLRGEGNDAEISDLQLFGPGSE